MYSWGGVSGNAWGPGLDGSEARESGWLSPGLKYSWAGLRGNELLDGRGPGLLGWCRAPGCSWGGVSRNAWVPGPHEIEGGYPRVEVFLVKAPQE